MAYRYIVLRRRDFAAYLTFNRPERRNALTHDMIREVGDAVSRIAGDRGIRALVLRGAGGAFCAGGDLGAMSAMPGRPRRGADPMIASYRAYGTVFERLNRLPQAVVAVVEGPAVGGGIGMVCCADVVILHRSAKLGIPEPRSGFIPSQVIPFLVRRIGEGNARRLAVTGQVVPAATALEMGLGHILCADLASLERRLREVLQNIRAMEPDAVATVKRLVLACATSGDRAVMDRAGEELVRLLRGPRARAGMAAFLAKKLPPWAA